ncbi:hypothetical protein [Pseudorhodoferax sp.]|uniref:hypothetical protein n=1 Tax=Pseudorhodoferax sp. TaxID=1993553 RepID=UPI002DD645CD|nr:hypothetical protein [Pseudorhodoferax sp.]
MTQALLDLDLHTTAAAATTPGRVGFDIGWEHARHALVPPAALLLADAPTACPVGQGWRAGRAVFGARTATATRAVRQWLALRLQAWQEGAVFEEQQVTPQHLVQLDTRFCPVTRKPLGGAPDGDDAPVLVRLCDDAGYVAGNLVVLSRAAARAKAGRSAVQLLDLAARQARAAADAAAGTAAGDDGVLDADAWVRLATLASFAVELPQAEAARVPLRALPPRRVRVLNPAQELQTLLTLRLQAAGWSRRAAAMADLLPRQALRHDFNLFVGALAARLMAIPGDADTRAQHWALEDAWACPRVQRRWSHLMLQFAAGDARAWLQRLTTSALGPISSPRAAPRLQVDGSEAAPVGRVPASAGRLLQGRAGSCYRAGATARPAQRARQAVA